MKLSEKLSIEITSLNEVEPNVLIFVDESALFWVTDDGYYVWLQSHIGIDEYVNEDHTIEERKYTDKNVEGVGLTGVYWMNKDFEAPYHISDFTDRIAQINVSV